MDILSIIQSAFIKDGDLSDLSLGLIGLLVLAGIIWNLV